MCLFTIGEQPMTYFYVRSLYFLSCPVFSFLFSLYMLCFLLFLTDIIPVCSVFIQHLSLFLFHSLFHSLSRYISILLLTLSLLTYSLRSYFLNSTCIVADIFYFFILFILSYLFHQIVLFVFIFFSIIFLFFNFLFLFLFSSFYFLIYL